MKIKKKNLISPKAFLAIVALPLLAFFGIKAFDYGKAIKWDNENNVSVYQGELPSSYDLRDHVAMENHYQWPWGTCWSFATTRAIETYLELHNEGLEIDLSRLHPAYMMSEDFGGELDLNNPSEIRSSFYAYMTRYNDQGFGEVLEVEVPYSNDADIDAGGIHVRYPYDVDDYDYLYSLNPSAFVTNVVNYSQPNAKYTDSQLELIKRHIINNGSLYAVTTEWATFRNYQYISYNEDDTSNRYYDGSIGGEALYDFVNHAYAIIGWDDNYPKERFAGSSQPSRDGAFIVLNSDFGYGLDGDIDYSTQIGYTSYEDLFVSYDTFGVSGATTDLMTASQQINIPNQNLYVALKESPSLKKMIVQTDDDSRTLWLLNTYKNVVTTLDLSNHRLDSIAGLNDIFPNLTSIDLSHCVLTGNYIDNIIRVLAWQNIDLSYTGITNQDVAAINKTRGTKLQLSGNQITSLAGLEGYDLTVDVSNNPITARSLNQLDWNGGELRHLIIDGILASSAQVSSFCNRVYFCTNAVSPTVLLSGNNTSTSTIAIPDELYETYRKDKYRPNTILHYDDTAISFNWQEKTMTFAPSTNRNHYVEFSSDRNASQKYLLQANISSGQLHTITSGSGQSYTRQDEGSIQFGGDGNLADFTGCLIDGDTIDTADYTLSYGSTIVELSPGLLSTLSDGVHTFTMIWNDGAASTEFSIATILEFGGTITNNTNSGATISVTATNSFIVTSDEACVVLSTRDNGSTWSRLEPSVVDEDSSSRLFSVPEADGTNVMVFYAGDVNADKSVNTMDARAIINSITGRNTLSNMALKIADVDNNNSINTRDARKIINNTSGKAKINW